MAVLNAFALLPASPPAKSGLLPLFTLGFVMSFSTGLANVSLKYNRWDLMLLFATLSFPVLKSKNYYYYYFIFSSVGFYQMAKIAVTPSIVLAEFICYRKRVSVLKVTFPFWHIQHGCT